MKAIVFFATAFFVAAFFSPETETAQAYMCGVVTGIGIGAIAGVVFSSVKDADKPAPRRKAKI